MLSQTESFTKSVKEGEVLEINMDFPWPLE